MEFNRDILQSFQYLFNLGKELLGVLSKVDTRDSLVIPVP